MKTWPTIGVLSMCVVGLYLCNLAEALLATYVIHGDHHGGSLAELVDHVRVDLPPGEVDQVELDHVVRVGDVDRLGGDIHEVGHEVVLREVGPVRGELRAEGRLADQRLAHNDGLD